MRLAAGSVLIATLILLSAPSGSVGVRQAAQVEFMHGMATFACATFMNVGAARAKFAPALFLAGSALHCGPVYLSAADCVALPGVVSGAGAILLAGGWVVLIAAGGTVDQ